MAERFSDIIRDIYASNLNSATACEDYLRRQGLEPDKVFPGEYVRMTAYSIAERVRDAVAGDPHEWFLRGPDNEKVYVWIKGNQTRPKGYKDAVLELSDWLWEHCELLEKDAERKAQEIADTFLALKEAQ